MSIIIIYNNLDRYWKNRMTIYQVEKKVGVAVPMINESEIDNLSIII